MPTTVDGQRLLAALDALETATDAVVALPLEEIDETTLRTAISRVEDIRSRLYPRLVRAAGRLVEARTARERAARPRDVRAAERATRDVQRQLQQDLNWAPSEAKRATTLGRRLPGTPQAGRAFDTGSLPARQAALLVETLDQLEPTERRAAEEQLVPLARREDPIAFGRSCRRLLAELDHDAAMRAEQRRQVRRSARLYPTDDGMTGLSCRFAGVDAELVATAVQAFRRPDPADALTRRSSEQATADAVVAMAKAALDAGSAPAQHGVRPHLLATVPAAALEDAARSAGVAELAWTGPVPAGILRPLLNDVGLTRVVVDARSLPLEVSEEVRTVPMGLYRALLVRDRTCIREGCDHPAAWCQMMHLGTPYRRQGKLSPSTAALGCPEHHRRYDHGSLLIVWRDGKPVMVAPGEAEAPLPTARGEPGVPGPQLTKRTGENGGADHGAGGSRQPVTRARARGRDGPSDPSHVDPPALDLSDRSAP